jgi:high-affinity iron transporter
MAIDGGALLIGLREGLEALLVLGILVGMLRRFGHPEKGKLLWLGAAAGVLASVLVGLLIEQFVATWFESQGGAALFEIVVALTAVSILTYMVIWMQKHTTQLLDTARRAVKTAVDDGRWAVLATLAFVTVFREGLETVLFYSARSGEVPWMDLILSGVIGFAVSAVIAFAIFRLTVKVDLRKFFAITGTLLVFIAAGLLIHVAHAMADLGWIGHGTPLWDTSAILPDEDHWLGGPLHALIGYEDQPTAFGLLLYLTYLVGIGGFYLASLVRAPGRTPALTAAGAALLLVVSSFAFAGAIPGAGTGPHSGHEADAAHASGVPHEQLFANASTALEGFDGKIGILVRAHGEPVHYNATTYESFKAFVDAFWPYTGFPAEMLKVDQGTVLLDKAHPWAEEPQADAKLMDAWLADYPYPAIPITDPSGLHSLDEDLAGGQFYLAPGNGPGVGEGDIYEAVGLGSYRLWLKMENQSPMYGYVQEAWSQVDYHGQKHWGDKVVFAFAHHVDPKMDPNETTEAAARYLVSQGVDVVVDAYMSSVHSDAMNTCMMRPHTEHALREAGFKGPIVAAGMAGTTVSWARATADYAEELVGRLPINASVSVHLRRRSRTIP